MSIQICGYTFEYIRKVHLGLRAYLNETYPLLHSLRITRLKWTAPGSHLERRPKTDNVFYIFASSSPSSSIGWCDLVVGPNPSWSAVIAGNTKLRELIQSQPGTTQPPAYVAHLESEDDSDSGWNEVHKQMIEEEKKKKPDKDPEAYGIELLCTNQVVLKQAYINFPLWVSRRYGSEQIVPKITSRVIDTVAEDSCRSDTHFTILFTCNKDEIKIADKSGANYCIGAQRSVPAAYIGLHVNDSFKKLLKAWNPDPKKAQKRTQAVALIGDVPAAKRARVVQAVNTILANSSDSESD